MTASIDPEQLGRILDNLLENSRKYAERTPLEFAKLCGVTPRTLKYYETRGLIRPALVGENGYRYYSLSQIDEISAILLFRDYGFSLEEIKTIMEQDDLAGIEQRMGMMLSIIKEQKRKLEQQAKNIRYTCTQVAEARKHLGEPFLQNREPQRIAFEPVALMKDQSFVINYLTDGLRNGTAFGGPDLTVKGRYQTEPSGPEILSGKGIVPLRNGLSTARNRRKSIHRRQGCRSVTGERLLRNDTGKHRAGEMFVSVFYGGARAAVWQETEKEKQLRADSKTEHIPEYGEYRKHLKGGSYSGVPKFIVETLSPATALRDKTVKKEIYRAKAH